MPRSPLFAKGMRVIRLGHFADENRLSTGSALDRAAEIEYQESRRSIGRREFLRGLAGMAAVLGAGALPGLGKAAAKVSPRARIAIVGGGLAGLVCADKLRSAGISATLYEANRRLGGRVLSTRAFPGQVAEKGGELVDNLHKTMLGYALEFGLAREDLNKAPGETFYFFFGRRYSEQEVIDQYRELVARMRPDLRVLGTPTFFSHTDAEAALDFTDLASYLDLRARDLPLIKAMLNVAYNIEYGLETYQQSCLNLLLFIHLDRRSKFMPFGIFSNERFHIVEGNDRIAMGIAERLPGPIETGAQLVRLGRNSAGKYELWFSGARTPELADAVVLTLPFSVLRDVTLESGLGLSPDKRRAIAELTYGANAKTMIGFNGRPWWQLYGCNGDTYSNLPNLQNTWETSWTAAGSTAILTDYAGGNRGKALQVGTSRALLACSRCHGGGKNFFEINDSIIQQQADDFLTDLDKVLPGSKVAATRIDNKYRVVRGHWLPQSFFKGSYTCNAPGYFTTIAGLEGQSAGLLKFAGEHTNSFYKCQGYMEGACLSGIAAANELLDDIRRGRL